MLRGSALLLTLLVARPAYGQDGVEAARARFDEGTVHYREGRFLEAAEAYEEAYRLSPRPVILRNAATAYERALELERAAEALERYLEAAEDPEDEAEVRARIARLRQLTERPPEQVPTEPPPAPTTQSLVVWPVQPPAYVPPAAVAPPVDPPEEPGPPPPVFGILGVSTGGVALVLGAVAIGFGVEALDRAALVDETCPDRVCPFRVDSRIFGDAREAAALSSGFGYVSLGFGALAALFTALAIVELGGDEDDAAFLAPSGVGVRF